MLPCPPEISGLSKVLAVEEFASTLRHNLRNKLTAIRNATYYLRRKTEATTTLLKDDSRAGSFFQLIDSELDACNVALESFKASSTPGSVPHTAAALVAAELVASIKMPPEIRLSGPELIPGEVPIDSLLLKVALFSLLENAVDAIEASGGKGEILVRSSRPTPNTLVLEVLDTGPGFVSGDARPGRLGVGLKIARKLMGAAGGKLELGRIEKQGTRAALVFSLGEGGG